MFPIGAFPEPGGSLGTETDGGSRPPLCFGVPGGHTF